MGFKELSVLLFVVGCCAAQTYRVCVRETEKSICNTLELGGSQTICEVVESRIDCALKLARSQADFGVFTEEETLLLAQQQPNDNRVVATVRDVSRIEQPYDFQAVAIVPSSHTNGLTGLQGARYCHPGFDVTDNKWSPRVLRAFEQTVARTDQCPGDAGHKTVEEFEVETLDKFFSAACRPGVWSTNATVDARLKTQYPQLCSLCGNNSSCSGYALDMGVAVAGVDNNNRHIQALECLRTAGTGNSAVAYVSWLHVREYFITRNPQAATSYATLCPDGVLRPLTTEVLNNATAPCAFITQPWRTIVAATTNAAAIQTAMRTWWPNGVGPTGVTWQSTLFNYMASGANGRVVFEETLRSPANYTSSIRTIPGIDATASCLPTRRWCTLSAQEQAKCNWVRAAAYSLGIQPTISCQQRPDIFTCLNDIKEGRVDFIASSSNYGYLARQHYQISPIKLLQNRRSSTSQNSRVAAFVKETSAQNNIARFENLRGKKACFPEYGGIAYMAFIRTAHERQVISATECDYLKAAGEFFDGACAPGALDASHTLSHSDFNATSLCSVCKPAIPIVGNFSDFTCAWDYSNKYYGTNGTLACLADPATDVAFLQTENIQAALTQLGLQASQFRALCRNNTLAATTGVNIDDGCVLAHIVDSEVVTRRNDQLNNALSVLLETLDVYFGYTAETGTQLINVAIFSPFDGVSDLLFKDSAIGFTEPTSDSANELARNYIELFRHLESCTGAAAPGPVPGVGSRSFVSMVTFVLMALAARFIV